MKGGGDDSPTTIFTVNPLEEDDYAGGRIPMSTEMKKKWKKTLKGRLRLKPSDNWKVQHERLRQRKLQAMEDSLQSYIDSKVYRENIPPKLRDIYKQQQIALGRQTNWTPMKSSETDGRLGSYMYPEEMPEEMPEKVFEVHKNSDLNKLTRSSSV